MPLNKPTDSFPSCLWAVLHFGQQMPSGLTLHALVLEFSVTSRPNKSLPSAPVNHNRPYKNMVPVGSQVLDFSAIEFVCHHRVAELQYLNVSPCQQQGIRQLAFIEKSVFSLQIYGLWCLSTDGALNVSTDERCYNYICIQAVMIVSIGRRCSTFFAFSLHPQLRHLHPICPSFKSACSSAANGERINKTKLCA